MATDWTAEQLGAYNDIKEDGVAITVRSLSFGTYDPVTDATTGGGTTEYPTYTLITAFKDSYDSGIQALPGDDTAVKMGDRNFLIPAYGLPDMGGPAAKTDFDVVYKNNVHHIMAVETIEPGGTAVLFRVHGRR